jgi:hypothetical protein
MLTTTEGKKKRKKNTTLYAWHQKIFREQKQNPNCDGSKIGREKDLRRAEAARGTAYFGRTTFLRRRSSRWVQLVSTYFVGTLGT